MNAGWTHRKHPKYTKKGIAEKFSVKRLSSFFPRRSSPAMSRWPSFNLSLGTKSPTGPTPVDESLGELPDIYRLLDPSYTNKKRGYGAIESRCQLYRDEEGVLHHPTYRPFPPLVPPPKKLPPDERPAYFERVRLPPAEELPPTDPVPKIPPWKLPRRPAPEPKKKSPKPRPKKPKAQIEDISGRENTEPTTAMEQESPPTQAPEGGSGSHPQSVPLLIAIPQVLVATNEVEDYDLDEQESQPQLLNQFKQGIKDLIQAARGCFYGEAEGPLQS
ncbi:hypothetical protein NP233_g55 [Leucocoprinus birnbaumii]|uniref:Uncharacterized protein n=1 Tax=Leucocoprinus birnbaumii TaxID=56174 RepID=A0AAD5Z0I4_9AGAR|nr:hypothetical protein NP233_g55 [Leucocoprinus birnbaumii]